MLRAHSTGAMKVDPKPSPLPTTTAGQNGPSFRQVLRAEAKTQPMAPVAAAIGGQAHQVTARSTAAVKTAEAAGVARGRVEAEAGRLASVRAGHMVQAQQVTRSRQDAVTAQVLAVPERALDAITRELVGAFDGRPSRVANDHPGKEPTPAPVGSVMETPHAQSAAEFKHEHQVKAAQAVALIERIELFVKGTQRPAIALTLNNALGARVEIERIGPREISLKLVGQHGPPSPDAVSRIREELHARGLKVCALSVA